MSKYALIFGLKAADLQKSSFHPLMEADEEGVDVPLVAFNKIVLDGSKPRGLRMFRMAEDPTVLGIDQHIKTALRKTVRNTVEELYMNRLMWFDKKQLSLEAFRV